jgi:hypothetical protein
MMKTLMQERGVPANKKTIAGMARSYNIPLNTTVPAG